ncbi:MAG: nucleotidyl transferase AbiEii/AbiGii toxin family protein [Rubrivivax sp.]|nr:nucleotidyl transferase AbiEii/AbiGii toxin family protein [Rubrivivax sp.]
MPEFFELPRGDQREALLVAAERSGRPLHLLEKDVWGVWALRHLFTGPHAQHLVFKGGTSLSKAYGVIRRFSEDVDLTYDIRAIAPDLIEKADSPWPTSRSQEKKWSKAIRQRLAELVSGSLAPELAAALTEQGLPAEVRAEDEQVFIDYEALGQGTGYVAPSVLLEFGARSTGEPNELRPVACDAAPQLPELGFPEATPQVMRPERTFWEKATAIHVFCAQGSFRGGARFARHWHDVTRLDAAGFADSAAKDRALAHAVAEHKSIFFAESTPDGAPIDYLAAVKGTLTLAPAGEARKALAEDYQRMVEDGLLLDDAEPFDVLLDRCQALADRVNAMVRMGP